MVRHVRKVVHFTEAFCGGVATFMRYVLPAQAQAGLQVTLVCCPREPEQDAGAIAALERAGVSVRILPLARGVHPAADVRGLAGILRVLSEERPDILHTHGFKAGLLGRLAARWLGGIRTVHTAHCFPFQRAPSGLVRAATRAAERWLSRRTDCFLCVSASERDAATSLGMGAEVHPVVVPNGLPEDLLLREVRARVTRESLTIPPDALAIGTCCRLTDYKAADHLVRAVALLKRRWHGLTCLIVGDGSSRPMIERLITRLALADTVKLLGHRADAVDVIGALDVLVQCSRAEGMPYAVLQAMSLGRTVVASRVAGHVDLVADGMSGLLYPFGDVPALAAALERCLRDPCLRQQLGSSARRHVRRKHRLTQQVSAMLDVYESVLAAAAGGKAAAARVEAAAGTR